MRVLLIIVALVGSPAAGADLRGDVDDKLAAALERAVGDFEAQIVVRSWKTTSPAALESASHLESLELLPGTAAWGRVMTRAVLRMRDGSEKRVFVIADVLVQVPVWVVSRRLGRGAPIHEFTVSSELRSMRGLSSSAIRSSEAVMGKVTARALSAGSVLTRGAVTTLLLVRRGDTVTVTSVVGIVRVRARGRVLAQGCRGDRVNVLLNSKRVVSGEVTGHGEVSIR